MEYASDKVVSQEPTLPSYESMMQIDSLLQVDTQEPHLGRDLGKTKRHTPTKANISTEALQVAPQGSSWDEASTLR